MGSEDWKMGMISDCYQLQENQRKNDPLTVKTPSPPCTGSPPAWWMQGGRLRAHCLRLILRRRRSLPPALPLSRFPLGEFKQGAKPRKALRVNGSRRMPKRYNFQHSRMRRWGAGGAGGRDQAGREDGATGSPGASRPPALLPYSGHAPKRAAGAAPPRMSSRAKGKSWYFRFGTENACQGIILDMLEYSCMRNYLHFGRRYIGCRYSQFPPIIH